MVGLEKTRNMDGDYWNGGQVPMIQGGGAAVEQSALGDNTRLVCFNDWRTQLPPQSRHRMVDYIMEIMKKIFPSVGQVLLDTITKGVVEFEEMVYSTATSQSDYLRTISSKMLTMETKFRWTASSLRTNRGSSSSSLASQSMRSHIPNQALSMPIVGAGNIGAGDWQEEVYQKIKSMKDMYLLQMNEMYGPVATKLKQVVSSAFQHETLPQLTYEMFEKLKMFKLMLERFIQFVQLSKNDIHISHKDKLGAIEKQIKSLLLYKPCKIAPIQPDQLPQPHLPGMHNSQLQSQISRIHNSQPQSQIAHMQNSQLQSLNSHMQTRETGNTSAGDWQGNKSMKDMNVLKMDEMYVKIDTKKQELEKLMHKEQIDLNVPYP